MYQKSSSYKFKVLKFKNIYRITKTCNCSKRDLENEGCPLGGFCLTPNVIYGATVKILDIFGDPIDITKETYTGLSEPPWT